MTEPIEALKKITTALLSPETGPISIRNACNALKHLLNFSIGFDEEEHTGVDNIHTHEGIATNPIGAVNCINDIMRTRVFLMGIRDAIQERLVLNPGRPVTVLYAGTGPFATLITPLTTVFTPAQMQLVLLEINPVSFHYLHKTIKLFSLEPFIIEVMKTDAAAFCIPNHCQPDIIVSETMMAALKNEPQLAIMANLVTQSNRKPIMIPETISVEVAFISPNAGAGQKIYPLDVLLEFTAETAVAIKKKSGDLPVFAQGIAVRIDKVPAPEFKMLCFLTSIQVFKENKLGINKSGLTVPIGIIKTSDLNNYPSTFRFQYKMGTRPGFVVSREQ